MSTQSIGRNDPCWCGSGRKYKKCHWAADQQVAAERAARVKAREARLAALGRPSDAEIRERYQALVGRAAPPGPLPAEAREAIVETWQQEKLAEEASAVLDSEREKWAGYFEENVEEFEQIASELAADPSFDQYELLPQNVRKVRAQLGPLTAEHEGEELDAYVREALRISLDEDDRTMFRRALRSLLPDLVEEGNLKAAYVVETAADRVLDPDAPLSPFLRDVVRRSMLGGVEKEEDAGVTGSNTESEEPAAL